MTSEINSEKSRLRTLLMRSQHLSPEEADLALERLALSIHVAKGALNSPASQAALVTAILLGARCFGTVRVSGDYDHEITATKLPIGKSISEVMTEVGAIAEAAPSAITIAIGTAQLPTLEYPCIELSWDGWIARATPNHRKQASGDGSNPLAGIAAAAMGLGTAFMREIGDPNAGRRMQEISLWSPGAGTAGPRDYVLPSALWMIGLGNLGQAYLWCLSWLPYPDCGSVRLYLQDFDRISKENWGTSILVRRDRYGMLKSRAAEDWALEKGFVVNRIDRHFDEHTFRAPTDPHIALAGLDKLAPRKLLGKPGFKHIIDAGLGSTLRNFRDFRINVFDKGEDPGEHFKGLRDQSREELESVLSLPAYKNLLGQAAGGNCGALTLAGQPIVLPFISGLTAALAITQAIRLECGVGSYKTIVGRIDDSRNLRAVQNV